MILKQPTKQTYNEVEAVIIVENMSVHSNASVNTLGPSFQIDLQSLIKTTDLLCGEDDSKQVANVIKRHMSALKKVIAS